MGKFGPDKNLIKKYERCSCGVIIRDVNMKAHKIICEMNEKWGKYVYKKRQQKKYNYPKKPPIKCGICGKMIGYRNMSAHKKNVHGLDLYAEYVERRRLQRLKKMNTGLNK